MARRFAAAGHDVHVVATKFNESSFIPRWSVQDLDGITVHWIPVKYETGMGFNRRMAAFLAFAWLASWRSRRLKPDVVFATSTPLTIAIPGVFATVGRRTPMVFEVRDLWPEFPSRWVNSANPLGGPRTSLSSSPTETSRRDCLVAGNGQGCRAKGGAEGQDQCRPKLVRQRAVRCASRGRPEF